MAPSSCFTIWNHQYCFAVPAPVVDAVRPVLLYVQESKVWRYAGRIVIEGMERIVLDSERGGRLIPPSSANRMLASTSCVRSMA